MTKRMAYRLEAEDRLDLTLLEIVKIIFGSVVLVIVFTVILFALAVVVP